MIKITMWVLTGIFKLVKVVLSFPLVRHFLAGLAILAIGYFYAASETKLVEGKYTELQGNFKKLENRTNTLQKTISDLAKEEKIKIENNIEDVKVKDGSSIDFRPENDAKIENVVKRDTSKTKKRGLFKKWRNRKKKKRTKK